MATHIMNDPPAFLFRRFAGLFVVVHVVHLPLNELARSTLSRLIGEKNLVNRDADDLTDSFRSGDSGTFGRLLDFAVCIARNAKLFRHFTLRETSVLAGLFNGESQTYTSFHFWLENTILHFQ